MTRPRRSRSESGSELNRPPPRSWSAGPRSILRSSMYGLFALLVAACRGEQVAELGDRTIVSQDSDSANVRVVESSEAALQVHLPWLEDTVPGLEIGGLDGQVPFMFTEINGIADLPDGGLVVIDGGSAELRWFTASGSHQEVAGGRGQGPAEFGRPKLLSRFEQDSLAIFDRGRRRLVRVASDGSSIDVVTPADLDRRLLAGSAEAVVGSRVVFRVSETSPSACPENETCELPMHLRWVDVESGESGNLATYSRRWLNYVDARGGRFLIDGWFDHQGLVAAGPAGLVVEGGSHFELRQLDLRGNPSLIMRLSKSTEPVSSAILDYYASQTSDPREMKRIFDMAELPDALPAFSALQVDRVGYYWAKLFNHVEIDPPEWLVFDSEGRALGTVEFPAGFEVAAIGEDYVLGKWTDQLGVEYVRRYSLQRSGIALR